MPRLCNRGCFFLAAAAVLAPSVWGQKYNGPRPEKTDLPHLLHAGRLVETDPGEAQASDRKDATVYTVPGASAKANTPLAEPIFLISTRKLQPERLAIYRFEVRGGQREVIIPKKGRGGPRPYRVVVTRLDEGLYRIEAAETLEPGEYALTPDDSNLVFCFRVV